MSGRASGRARGVAPAPQAGDDIPGREGHSSPDSPSRRSPQEAVFRGRGGVLVTRPPNTESVRGSGGRAISLFANYFKMVTPSGDIVNSYHVRFNPEVESSAVRKKLMQKCSDLFNNAYIFDTVANVKSFVELDKANPTVKEIPKEDGTIQQVIIKWTETIGFGSQEMIRMYNTQMRRNFMHIKWLMIFQHYYDPTNKVALPNYNLTIWGGLSTAIHEFDGGLMMVCDTVNKLVRDETAFKVLKDVFINDRANFKNNAKKELVGAVVMTAYNNKSYRIDDIDFDKNPSSTFERRGVPISFQQYYKEAYNVTIGDAKQPLLVCLPSARDLRHATLQGKPAPGPCLLIPELCTLTGLSEKDRANFNLKKTLTESTQLPPVKKYQNLKNFRSTLNANDAVKEEMSKWKLGIENDCVSVEARILEGEKVLMHGMWGKDQGIPYNNQSGDFSREIRSSKMFHPVGWSDWAILFTQRDESIATGFQTTLQRVCGPMGVTFMRPSMITLPNDRPNSYIQALQKLNPGQFVVCIVPNNNSDRYDTIKKFCCIESPRPSQVIVSKTLSNPKNLMTVATKVGIQMAAKVGAQPWAFFIPVKGIMVVGYDTYHDGALKGKSVGGFVCSLNDSLTSYYSRVAYHSNRDEMSSNFAGNFELGLKAYQKHNNGSSPSRIVIYRDGVGEGMIGHVYETEVKAINDKLRDVVGTDESAWPGLVFTIVTKKISTRFFHKNQEKKMLDNPPPGTVVDSVVTRPERFEFYLVSQSVRAGTVSPTCYNIIRNTTTLKANAIQSLSFKLTNLYYNWMGGVRVPAPCQYAHKLAFLVGTSLHREPNNCLSDTLYYL